MAVLGAGIGGTSAAYFLSKNLPEASIDILEMGNTGKRL
ncbi:MAG: NAD(P)-binding protein [bacterium]